MTTGETCSECGSAIPADSPGRFCGRCLFGLALPTDTDGHQRESGVAGQRFGDYELLAEIARGGMGVVYRARQISLDRLIALKLVNSTLVSRGDLVRRFKGEAKAAASLFHPNIVPIHEIGEVDGQPFFSMGLIAGGNLHQVLAPKTGASRDPRLMPSPACPRFQPAAAATLIETMARAVHYAHQRGILHRDIKPGNILLDESGEPHLTDFGLAKLMDQGNKLTHTQAILGTPAYMAPEQARGGASEVTTAVDVYGLGAVFYELLTGRPPFIGPSAVEIMRQVLDEEPRPPSQHHRDIDRDLETVCLKCLEKDPQRRYGSAAALSEDLTRWLNHEPVVARRASRLERMAKWSRRQPLLAVAIALLNLVFFLGLAGILWQWRRAEDNAAAEARQRKRAEAGQIRAERAEASAEARLYEVRLNYIRANRLTGQAGQRYDSLAEINTVASSQSNSLALRNELIACLTLPDARLLKEWTHLSLQSVPFHLSGAFRFYATNDALGQVTVRDLASDSVVALLPGPVPTPGPTSLLFSPDDRYLAIGHLSGELELLNLSTRQSRWLDLPPGARLLLFTPDSRALVIQFGDDSLHFFEPESAADEWSIPAPGPLTANKLGFTPDGRRFVMQYGRRLTVHRAADGEQLAELDPLDDSGPPPGGPTWQPDGRRVAAAQRPRIAIWDADTGRLIGGFIRHESAVVGLAFLPESGHLISTSWDGTTRWWDPDTGREVLQLREAGNALRVSSDSRRIALYGWGHRTLRVYELPDLSVRHRAIVPKPPPPLVNYTGKISFSAEGDLLAAPDKHGVHLYAAGSGAFLGVLPDCSSGEACFAPDGTALYTGGPRGAQRWPLKRIRRNENPLEVHLGPPQLLEPTRGMRVDTVELSARGEWLVAQAGHSLMTLETRAGGRSARMTRALRLSTAARISPDGRWVATITPNQDRIQIFHGPTGQLVTNLSTRSASVCAFSPDGRWLGSIENGEIFLRDIADWTRRKQVSHPLVIGHKGFEFSSDSKVFACFVQDERIHVFSVDSAEEIAEFPAGRLTTAAVFSPAFDTLAVANESGYVDLWNLGRIRTLLSDAHLDWRGLTLSAGPPEPNKWPPAPRVFVHTTPPKDANSPPPPSASAPAAHP